MASIAVGGMDWAVMPSSTVDRYEATPGDLDEMIDQRIVRCVSSATGLDHRVDLCTHVP